MPPVTAEEVVAAGARQQDLHPGVAGEPRNLKHVQRRRVRLGFVELMVEPVPKQTKDGFEAWELPANQYTRMGDEALALQDWLAQDAA